MWYMISTATGGLNISSVSFSGNHFNLLVEIHNIPQQLPTGNQVLSISPSELTHSLPICAMPNIICKGAKFCYQTNGFMINAKYSERHISKDSNMSKNHSGNILSIE